MDFAIGIDLGGTNLRVAAVSTQGELLEKITVGTRATLGRDAVVKDMVDGVARLTRRFGSPGRLLGVGVGVPGIIDQRTGMLRRSPNLPGLSEYPIHTELERLLGTTVILENDANAAAIGESWLGAGQTAESTCMITLGTGVGGGLVLGGRVWRGMSGMAGEVGHVCVDPNGPKCGCGSNGCVEQFASATAVMRMAREAIATGGAPALERAAALPGFSPLAINNLAIQNDEPSRTIYSKVGWALGVLLADLINTLNLDAYVIGGGVSGNWAAFAPAMFSELRRRSFVYTATTPDGAGGSNDDTAANVSLASANRFTRISRALLGSDAGLFGAARMAMLDTEVQRVRASA